MSPALYRWPYFSCIQVVAAFGQLIALRAHRQTHRCHTAEGRLEESVSALCMDSNCVSHEYVVFETETGASTTGAIKWNRLEAVSNFELSENLLASVERIWPYARRCRGEIEACRSCINGIDSPFGLQIGSMND
jgi:hypothetical protein